MLRRQQPHQGSGVGLGPLKVSVLIDADLDADAGGVAGSVGAVPGVIGRFAVRQVLDDGVIVHGVVVADVLPCRVVAPEPGGVGGGVRAVGVVARLMDGDGGVRIGAGRPVLPPLRDVVRLDGDAVVRDPPGGLHMLQIVHGHPALFGLSPAVLDGQNLHHRAAGIGPCFGIACPRPAANIEAHGRRHAIVSHALLPFRRRDCRLFFYPHADPVVHQSGRPDGLPVKVTLGAAAAVQHHGGGTSSVLQLAAQLLGRHAAVGAEQQQGAAHDAHGAPGPRPALGAVAGQLCQPLPVHDQGRGADVVVAGVPVGGLPDVLRRVPAVARQVSPGGGGQQFTTHL